MDLLRDSLLSLVLFLFGSLGLTNSTVEAPVHISSSTAAELVRVIDGDTIDVLVEGFEKRVRYIGIDTPEFNHQTGEADCFAAEAKNRNATLLGEGKLHLKVDQSEVDSYGRLLRYVYVEDEPLSHRLVDEGYAKAVYIKPDVKHYQELKQLEAKAKAGNLGLWGECVDD